jgi:hypothetical protein
MTQPTASTGVAEFRGRIYGDITETMGATPLIRLNRLPQRDSVTGEVPGVSTIIEPTSRNTPHEKGINEDFRSAFFDDWGSPWSVCRPPRPNNRGNLVATSAMILMRPGEGHLQVCPMPALNRRFTTYRLTPDRTAQRAAAAE